MNSCVRVLCHLHASYNQIQLQPDALNFADRGREKFLFVIGARALHVNCTKWGVRPVLVGVSQTQLPRLGTR